MADVFILIGVWVDKIIYWVLSQKEIKENPFLSHQHRGGIEYQIGVTDKNIIIILILNMRPKGDCQTESNPFEGPLRKTPFPSKTPGLFEERR